MEKLSYKPENLSPGVLLDKATGTFMIFGESSPENVVNFYDPVFNWIDNYCKDPLKTTIFDFKMTYFNTATAKIFLMIMIKLELLNDLGHEIKIRWFFKEEDEDLLEAGEEFETIVDIEFEFISLESDSDQQSGEDYFNKLMDDIV